MINLKFLINMNLNSIIRHEHNIPKYELIGIVVENEDDRGNFLSYSKCNEKWYLDNNSKFEIVDEFKNNIKNIPHLLIYQKAKE